MGNGSGEEEEEWEEKLKGVGGKKAPAKLQ